MSVNHFNHIDSLVALASRLTEQWIKRTLLPHEQALADLDIEIQACHQPITSATAWLRRVESAHAQVAKAAIVAEKHP